MLTFRKSTLLLAAGLAVFADSRSENGYRLWLRYEKISDAGLLKSYRSQLRGWIIEGQSPTLEVSRAELQMGLEGLIGQSVAALRNLDTNILVAGTPSGSPIIAALKWDEQIQNIGTEGFIISRAMVRGKRFIAIASKTDVGVL